MNTQLHIVCANAASHIYYGLGSLLYFELDALKAAGASIILHIFGEERVSEAITASCTTVHQYPIQSGHKAVSFYLPYRVAARQDSQLQQNLLKARQPAIFYGWESTGVLESAIPDKHRFFVRVSGIPHIQCREYASFTRGLLRKFFHFAETFRAKIYEKKLATRASFLSYQQKDQHVLADEMHASSCLLPILLKPRNAACSSGLGSYCMYFGDFSNPEQEKSAVWLLKEVFAKLEVPFILAGKSPSASLVRLAHQYAHTTIVIDPTEAELRDLISKSQVQLLPLFSETGLKSEVYHALLLGRHCLFFGSTYTCPLVSETCAQVKDAEEAREKISALYNKPFSESEQDLRNSFFAKGNSTMQYAHKFLNELYQF